MRLFASLIFFAVLAFCQSSFAEVQVIKVKHRDVTTTDSVLIAAYNQKIDRLDHHSDELTAKIAGKKSGLSHDEKKSRDGLQVTLMRAKR